MAKKKKEKINSIEVKNLTKRYKKAKVNAVNKITFSVKQGEFFALLGPNGAGKTTTISMLTTTLAKTSGKVTLAGYDLDKHPSQVRNNIGVIFQNPSLDKNLTAEENVRFHAILYGLYPYRPLFKLMPAEYQKKVKELIKLVGLENDMFKPIKSFSGGMKRKLEIVRSLIHNPKVLFLDEPTSGLDPLSRRNLWEYLLKVKKTENTTIFLTTHYLEEAEEADRICIINDGEIEILGTPEKIKEKLLKKYVLANAKENTKLKKELKAKKLNFTGSGPFKIEIDGLSAQKVIHKIKTPLTKLDIHNPTLEEAYLDIIEANEIQKEDHHAGN